MNIIISGFTASGKKTLADMLAKQLSMTFIDIDKYIENKKGLTLKQIYELYSQDEYKNLEREAIEQISQSDDIVLATGADTLLDSKNVNLLKSNGGVIVFLDVNVDTVFRRCAASDAFKNDRENAISQMLLGRLPIYQASADIIIDANDDDLVKKVNMLTEKLKIYIENK